MLEDEIIKKKLETFAKEKKIAKKKKRKNKNHIIQGKEIQGDEIVKKLKGMKL